MVGKPNFPPEVDKRKDLKGAARPTQGLAALDQERAASMADEGGAAGAAVEAESEARREMLDAELSDDDEDEEDEPPFTRPVATFLVAGTVSALAFLLVRRLMR
jgi:hypothetical protein